MNELKERIEYLRQKTDFTSALFKSIIGYSVIAGDFDGNIIAYNDGAVQIYGYKPEEVIEKLGMDSFFSKESIEAGELEQAIRNVMEKGEYSYESERVRKGGERFSAKITLMVVKTNEGDMVGFVEIVEDLTERKRWEAEIKKLNEELEQKVIERTAELEEANKKLKQQVEELERFKKATIQRELRMKELRDKVKEMEGKEKEV